MIEQDVHRFLQSKSMAAKTETNYRYRLTDFLLYCEKINLDPECANDLTVFDWFRTHDTWGSATQHGAISAVKSYFRWKFGNDHPVLNVKVKVDDPGPQRTLNRDEVMRAMSAIDTSTEIGIRDLAILTLLLDTGLRATEVCNLELKHLDIRKKTLKAKIKGSKWGDAVFFDVTAQCLARWLGIRAMSANPDCTTVFVSLGGRTRGNPMTISGIRMLTQRLAKLSGIDEFSPHTTRRTFATLAIENGAPTRLVQVAGRWRDIRMVEIYTRVLDADKIAPFSVVDGVMGLRDQKAEKK